MKLRTGRRGSKVGEIVTEMMHSTGIRIVARSA